MKKSYNFSDDINDVSSFPYIETYFFAAIKYLLKSFFSRLDITTKCSPIGRLTTKSSNGLVKLPNLNYPKNLYRALLIGKDSF